MWFSPARIPRASAGSLSSPQIRVSAWGLSHCAHAASTPSSSKNPIDLCAGCASKERSHALTHDRRAVVMNHLPLVADEFKKVRREDLGLLRFVGLLSGEILDANDPGHVACNLHHDIGEFELHREGVIEDQHPGIADGRPPGTNRPARVYTGDVFLMGPALVHLGDVETLKGIVELLVDFRNGVDTLFQHGCASQSAEPYHTASECSAARIFLRTRDSYPTATRSPPYFLLAWQLSSTPVASS